MRGTVPREIRKDPPDEIETHMLQAEPERGGEMRSGNVTHEKWRFMSDTRNKRVKKDIPR